MAVMEWAQVVLPLLALGWGVCLVAVYADVINDWAAKIDAWWAHVIGKTRA